jgi:hypothetical protein
VQTFLEALEAGRRDPTEEVLTRVRTTFLTIRVLAFHETQADQEVRERARTLTEALGEMVETRSALPVVPADIAMENLRLAIKADEADRERLRTGEGEPTAAAREASYRAWKRHAALRELQDFRIAQAAAHDEGQPPLDPTNLISRLDDYHLPDDLRGIIEEEELRRPREDARGRYARADERLRKDREGFADAVARWLGEGPTG